MLKVRDGKLEWTQLMRSNDLFRGLPHNIVQFTCLQEVIAGWLGLELGSYNHFSDSLHLYAKDGNIAEHISPMDFPRCDDSLRLSKTESDVAFARLANFGDLLVSNRWQPGEIIEMLAKLELSTAHANFAAILAADALRRKGFPEVAADAVTRCSNPCLTRLFDGWTKRNANN